jgi:RNA polymerase sigma-70 factor (ECF subfamily)
VQPSDAELAKETLAGSDAAYRALVARYATPAVNFAYRLVRDRSLAEDLAQEAFLRAFQRLGTYDPERKFSSWFFQVLRNITIDHLRVKRLDMSSLDQLTADGYEGAASDRGASSPEMQAEHGELARALDLALSSVRPEYREVVVLRYQEGLTHPEIAELLGVPVGTVKSYLHRARKELAAILSSRGWGPSIPLGTVPDGDVV